MAIKATLKRLGMTDSEHRAQFYGVQGQRCGFCNNQIVYGSASIYDKVTKTFFCRGCFTAVIVVRKVPRRSRAYILDWANGNKPHD